MNNLLVETYENDNYKLEIHVDDIPWDPREGHNLGTMICHHKIYDIGDKQIKNFHRYEDWWGVLISELSWEFDVYEKDLQTEEEREELLDRIVFLPISMYEHSNIRLSPNSRNQVGWLYCSKEKAVKQTGYTAKELYAGTRDRQPEVGEHIKIEDYDRYGVIENIKDNILTVNFDYHKSPKSRNDNNIVEITPDEIQEVMAYRLKEMLKNELQTYDKYVSGEVYRFKFYKKEKCEDCGHINKELIDSCGSFYGYDIKKNGMIHELPKEGQKLIEEQKVVA